MTVRFTATPQDFVDAFQLAGRMTRVRLIRILVLLVVIAAVLWALKLPVIDVIGALAAGCICGALAGVVLRWLYLPWEARRTFRRQPLARIERGLELRSDGLWTFSDRGETMLLWSDFIKWRVNRRVMLIWLGPRLYMVVPARLAALGFAYDELQERLRREVGPAR